MSLSISISTLPALGAALHGGIFAGLTTRKDGSHCAVVLLPDQVASITWKKAVKWAQKLEAELPSRPVAALLFANVKDRLRPAWHWTSESYHASYAWSCYFDLGQRYNRKSYEGSAVAVRLIPLTTLFFNPFSPSHHAGRRREHS
jgi:hypothetical protein